uniref:C2 domain-containing protein n=1 Tax=Chaetoceros debilis TaxID=122233 RepID=A0A7S3PU97_9STRA|mmetsp:Transcript_26329/g.40233  ORF Transcript_26329/g.40233 Transcript_26329/m.40233 type:complete len:319 (+) Transcript_26329:185-1141(+)
MRVQLHLEAKGLKNIAGMFKGYSDPYAVVRLASDESQTCRTEYIKNCLSPNWCGKLNFTCPELDEDDEINIEISIYDHNGNHKSSGDKTTEEKEHNYDNDTLMTTTETLVDIKPLLEEGIESEGMTVDCTDGIGTVTIHATQIPQKNLLRHEHATFAFQLRCLNLLNVEKGTMGLDRTDPFFEIAKKYKRPTKGRPRLQPVYRSEVIADHLNPCWDRDIIDILHLCDGIGLDNASDNDDEEDMTLVITVFDGTEPDTFLSQPFTRTEVGSVETSLRALQDSVTLGGNGDTTNAMRLKRHKGDRAKEVGLLVVLKAELR